MTGFKATVYVHGQKSIDTTVPLPDGETKTRRQQNPINNNMMVKRVDFYSLTIISFVVDILVLTYFWDLI